MAKDNAMSLGDRMLVPYEVASDAKSVKDAKKKLKKKIKKNLVPIIKSDNPDFNHEAAQKAAQMVMEMEEGEAQLFVKMVMAEVMEDTINKNRRTLQRHLDEVVEKRIERFKKAALSSISKGHTEEALEFAEAIAAYEEVIKARNPYEFGYYQFDESDFRRDPRTGRFQTKVRQPTGNRAKRPLGDKAAKNALGITTNKDYKDLSPEKKAQFQAEYAQVVNFLNMAQGMGGSDSRVAVQIQDEQGRRYWKDLNGAPKVGTDWDPTTEKVVTVEARPQGGLTLGGASYGLVSGLGAEGVKRVNTADAKIPSFADDWSADDYNPRNSHEKLYSRTKTGSKLVMDMTDERSKLHAAARFGQAVGDHGQSAEKVFGPPTRKAMYRYRGTEKQPDRELVRNYTQATQRANEPALDVQQRAKERAAITRARNAYRKQQAERHNADPANKGKPLDMNAIKIPREIDAQILQAAKKQATAPSDAPLSDEAKGAGRTAIIDYLTEKDPETGKSKRAPSKDLYNLQLESGVTPPSEGFIIDKDGKITTQAVGYGDDHYLPFNLRNIKSVRGGEYIRTRSVGGPTAEDIYTGLMAGAQKVTVVSRSGIFTIDFEKDFHGKRRYNDKAFRMVRRYEKLLDTVQSETVERNVQVDPGIRQIITRQVRDEGFDRTEIREEVKNRVQAYKDELNSITDEGELREYVEEFIGARTDAAGSDLSEAEKNRLAGQLRNDWQAQNEYKFRLNGRGYADAMKALQEQFPYYFKTSYQPTREMERIETEKDKGYVEPGRNRPTAARAGQFGTKVNQGEKFSASHADYQRARGQRGQAKMADARRQEGEGTTSPNTEGNVESTAGDKKKDEFKQKRAQIQYTSAAVKLHQQLALVLDKDDKDAYKVDGQKVFDMNEQEAKEWFADPKHAQAFNQFYDRFKNKLRTRDDIDNKLLRDFADARGNFGRKDYDPVLGLDPRAEFTFPGKAFEEGSENDNFRKTAVAALDKRVRPVSVDKKLSQMTETELRTEIEMLGQIYPTIRDEPDKERRVKALKEIWDIRGSAAARLDDKEKLDKQIKDVHKMIRLKELGGYEVEAQPSRVRETNTAPETKDDEGVKTRKQRLNNLLDSYNKAAQWFHDRNREGEAVKMDGAARAVERLLEQDVVSSEEHESLLAAHMDEGFQDLAGEALKQWVTRKKDENGT